MEGKKLEEMQAVGISELEAELTAKDQILGQTLHATKTSQEEQNKVHNAAKELQAKLDKALEAARNDVAEKDRAVKEAHESAQQA